MQRRFDAYFFQVGPGALAGNSERVTNAGAPLGSLFVLELEKGINGLFRSRSVNGEVVVLLEHHHYRQDRRVKVLFSTNPGEVRSAIMERAEPSVAGEGWMCWQGSRRRRRRYCVVGLKIGLRI